MSFWDILSPNFLFNGTFISGFSFTITKFSFTPTSTYMNCSAPRYSINFAYPIKEAFLVSQMIIFSALKTYFYEYLFY